MRRLESILSISLVILLGCFTSTAHATVIDVVSTSHTSAQLQLVGPGDAITIEIVLVDNDSVTNAASTYSSYDGYCLSMMDISLTVTGPGTLYPACKCLMHLSQFSTWAQPSTWIVNNAIEYLSGIGPGGDGIIAGGGYPIDWDIPSLVWCLEVRVDDTYNGGQAILVDLGLHGTTQYSEGPISISGSTLWGTTMPDWGGWQDATEDDMGGLIIGVEKPVIEVSATQFEFSGLCGEPNLPQRILGIYNGGIETLNWQITEDCPWLTVDPNSGSSSGQTNDVTLTVDTTGLDANDYHCELTISDPQAYNNPQTVQVSLSLYDDCWQCPTQCHGDTNCDGFVDTDDWPPFRDFYQQSWPDYDHCGDFNRDGIINTDDWPAFRDNFQTAPPADCPPDDYTPPPYY